MRATGAAGNASYRADGGQTEGLVVMAASVTGVAHRLAGRRCEDSFGWAQPRMGRLALVVADGVGSAGRGGEGADLAVGAACRHLLGSTGEWGQVECTAAIRTASEELELTGGAAATELSTTIVVAVLDAGDEGLRATLARVGDSTAFLLTGSGEWREVFGEAGEAEHRGGVYRTATGALPLPGRAEALDEIEVADVTLADVTALVLVTDGVAVPLRDGPGTVAPALAGLLRSGSTGELSPLELANAADFSRRGSHDDRTIVVAWPRPEGSASGTQR